MQHTKCCAGVLKMNMYELKVIDMSKKEEQAYEYSKRVSRGNPMTKDLAECSFMVGWDACMKHLASLPLDKAMREIFDSVKGIKGGCADIGIYPPKGYEIRDMETLNHLLNISVDKSV